MLVYALLVSTSFAASPPERPVPPEPLSGECGTTMGITIGQPLPDGFVDSSGRATCSGVVAPLSDYQDLLQTEIWAEALAQRYAIDTDHIEFERDWYRDQLVKSEQAPPFWTRPGVMIGAGVVSGVAAVLVSAYTLELVSGINEPG